MKAIILFLFLISFVAIAQQDDKEEEKAECGYSLWVVAETGGYEIFHHMPMNAAKFLFENYNKFVNNESPEKLIFMPTKCDKNDENFI